MQRGSELLFKSQISIKKAQNIKSTRKIFSTQSRQKCDMPINSHSTQDCVYGRKEKFQK